MKEKQSARDFFNIARRRMALGFLSVVISGAGCRPRVPVSIAPAKVPAAVPAILTEARLAQVGVNESGMVPILMYHNIRAGRQSTFRSPALFRKDLERLYAEGYRPVSMREYLTNRIAAPFGSRPVILTFDDALASQFRYLPGGAIDPDCAIGILQTFQKTHADWPLKAVFFLLPERAFGNRKERRRKFQALRDMGMELANHTVTHRYFNKLSNAQIKKEIAEGRAAIQALAPGARVDMLALPGGILPRSRNRVILKSGAWHSHRYANCAVFLAGGNPAHSPVNPHFNPYFLPRIIAAEDKDGITTWLDKLKAKPEIAYVSDGAPDTITVPAAFVSRVDKQKLHGAKLRVYGVGKASGVRH